MSVPQLELESSLCHQLTNANAIRDLAAATGWKPMLSASDQRSGILLPQSDRPRIRPLPAEMLRRQSQHHGIAATVYEDGIIRLSMPRTVLESEELQRIGGA